MLPPGWFRRITPTVSLVAAATAKRTNALASATVDDPSVSYWLLAELLMRPSSDRIDRPEPDDQVMASDAVPHPLWLARWNVSCTT